MSKKSTKLEALHDLFEENNIQVNLIEGNDALIEAVKKNAETIQDYRHQSYVRHPLVGIVMGSIDTKQFFRLTAELLMEAADSLLACAGKEAGIHEKSIMSVGGKASRGSAREESADGEVKALQALNVYSGDYGICLGQKFIEEKTNEMPAAQEVLRLMGLKDTIATADAMNCQKGTAAAVINAGGGLRAGPEREPAAFL